LEVFLLSVPVKYRQTSKLKIIGTRASTCDLGCEETPQLAHTSSTDSNTNSSPTYDSSNAKKTFQYKKGPLIGKGSYGEVNECLNLSSGEIIAAKSVKVINDLNSTKLSKVYGDLAKLRHYIEALKKEILVLKGLTHPNIVKYLAIETSENKEENYSQSKLLK
jgi:serine/threonine protein kinase